MLSGLPHTRKGELLGGPFTKARISLFARAVDSAFPYMDLTSKMDDAPRDREMIERAEAAQRALDQNPDITAEDFLRSDKI